MIKEFFKGEKDNIFSILKIASLVGVLVFFIFVNINLYKENKEKNEKVENLEQEIKKEEEKYQELEKNISATEQKEYWESKIREQGYKKPGEKQVVVLPLQNKELATTTKEKSFWEKAKERFTNLISF